MGVDVVDPFLGFGEAGLEGAFEGIEVWIEGEHAWDGSVVGPGERLRGCLGMTPTYQCHHLGPDPVHLP